MQFFEWKSKFQNRHLTEEMKEMISELRRLEHQTIEAEHERMCELHDFEEKVNAMLFAEWRLFLDVLTGNYDGPMS